MEFSIIKKNPVMFGYYRLATAVPQLRVADVSYNVNELIRLYHTASENDAAVIVFPELSITGASCGDLFLQPVLQQAAMEGLLEFIESTQDCPTIAILGLPLLYEESLFNVTAVVQDGSLLALIPKTILPNSRDSYQKRHFSSAKLLGDTVHMVDINGEEVPFGTGIILRDGAGPFSAGVELGDDLRSIIPPSSHLALAGARIILNPDAGASLVNKYQYAKDLVAQQSARCLCAYVHSSAGVGESTTDSVSAGHSLIAINGELIIQDSGFHRESTIHYADVDIERLMTARLMDSSFDDTRLYGDNCLYIETISSPPCSPSLDFARISPYPFLPSESEQKTRCEEILNIQTHGLAKRIEHTHAKKLVIGISGGLDSTLALIICKRACELLNKPTTDILALTMPGFGTTTRTRSNATEMCRLLGVEFREVPISNACLQHFSDIGHDPAERTTTYENVQARERTQILMDLANKHGGMVVGTGDLSEIALGWSTYNGDHMSMYSVNCSIPKTLIRCLIEHIAEHSSPELAKILRDINATPVSPELLPPSDDGSIEQKTEDVIGPYDLHDFFLYHFFKYGAQPDKILALAEQAFADKFNTDFIKKCLGIFIRRFFQQQFKRSCSPDGPKVGTIALSPRGDWRMPSDAWATAWQSYLED